MTVLNTWFGPPRRCRSLGPANGTKDQGNTAAGPDLWRPRQLLRRDIRMDHGLARFRGPAGGHCLWTSSRRHRKRPGVQVLRNRRLGQHRCPFLEVALVGTAALALSPWPRPTASSGFAFDEQRRCGGPLAGSVALSKLALRRGCRACRPRYPWPRRAAPGPWVSGVRLCRTGGWGRRHCVHACRRSDSR